MGCVTFAFSITTFELPFDQWLFAGWLHFIGRGFAWMFEVLRDGRRKWIVVVDHKDKRVLRGLTLTDGE